MSKQLEEAMQPKSDQLNADDLIIGAKTVTINGIDFVKEETLKMRIFTDELPRPYKPCKGMMRVMVAVWGSDEAAWIGKRMVLYNDPKVKFGGAEVGGIRISHMSDLESEKVLMNLTVSKNRRAEHIVYRLDTTPQPYPDDKFARLLPEWEKAINAGKMTTGDVLSRLRAVAIVSDEQQQAILSINNNEPEPEGNDE